MITTSSHPAAKPCPHGYGALSHCPECRGLRAKEAQRRLAKRREARRRMAALIATVIGPLPDTELQALLANVSVPLRTRHPSTLTCEHGETPMCDPCRKKHRARTTARWRKRKKRQGQSEGGTFFESEGGVEY